VVPASRAPSSCAWAGVRGAQAGLWGPPKRWASAEAPAPSTDGLEARAGKPPAARGMGTATVSDAPAAAAAAEMPLVRSAGIVSGTFSAAPSAAAPGEEKSVEMSNVAAPAAVLWPLPPLPLVRFSGSRAEQGPVGGFK